MELVCFQGLDKENYPQLNALIKRGEWEKIIVIKNKEAEAFISQENCETINVNSNLTITELKEQLMEKIKSQLGKDFEVALSLASGSGKEHMALISALLNIPVGIRLVAYTKNGVEFIS